MSTPRVSVLLPYRDSAATIAEALESVLADGLPDLEVIAIDDGSRDHGAAIVAAIAARDPRVRLLATGGVGIARALAAGLSIARAPYLARMDGDDVSLPGRLDRSLALLDASPSLGAVGTQVEAFAAGPVGEGMERYVAWLNGLITPADHARDLFVEAPLCHPSVTLRRSALDLAGGYRDPPWPEDYDLWLRLDAHGFGLAKVPAILLRWRHREGRATFTDPRYALAQHDAAKGFYLAPKLLARGRPIAVWGAGKTGKRIGRALARNGAQAELYVDIDPRKIGRPAQGVPIVSPSFPTLTKYTIVVALGARGARAIVRARLDAAGFVEGVDYVCAS
jgi:glycosyltransferase involved in cell wall biosynthesis